MASVVPYPVRPALAVAVWIAKERGRTNLAVARPVGANLGAKARVCLELAWAYRALAVLVGVAHAEAVVVAGDFAVRAPAGWIPGGAELAARVLGVRGAGRNASPLRDAAVQPR